MPLAATVPNSTSPAPPRTGSGTTATIAPRTGNRPSSSSRITPLTATTKRLLMPVTATSPTFWAKALTEKPLSTPATEVESMSACRPPVMSRRVSRLSTTSPMARMSAVVSVMITSITMSIEMIAPTKNVGVPKLLPALAGVEGQPRVGSVVAAHGRLDQPVGPVVGVEDLVVVLQPEAGQVVDEVVLVGGREADLGDLGLAG